MDTVADASEYENLARTDLYTPLSTTHEDNYIIEPSDLRKSGRAYEIVSDISASDYVSMNELSGSGYVSASDVSILRASDAGDGGYIGSNLSRTFANLSLGSSGYSDLKEETKTSSNTSDPSTHNNNNVSNNNKSSNVNSTVGSLPKPIAGSTWNSEFQLLQERSDSSERFSALAALAHDFFATAQHYAAIIVSEFHLPDYQRTIRQCTTIGGTAGGLKFVASGILFKFAHDPLLSSNRHLYSGGDLPDAESAAKALGHELKGAAGYYWSNVEGLSFPLMAVIDYMGFRVLAVSLLPISKATLRYGSDSGGRVAKALDPALNALMRRAGEKLNLSSHVVGSNKTEVYGPGDIEGHRGTDGRYYVLDFGRVYPCEAPEPSGPAGAIFYRLLRPELVRMHKTPLCSDAFTGFCRFDSRAPLYSEHVSLATHVLLFKEIPEFADRAGEIGYEFELVGFGVREFSRRFALVVELHRRGINVRHLGRVRFLSTSPLVRLLILSECTFRVLKNSLRARMRDLLQRLPLPRVSPFQQLLCDTYNEVLSDSPAFWSGVSVLLRRKFGERVFQGNRVDALSHVKQARHGAGAAVGVEDDAEAPHRLVDPEHVLHRLNSYFGGIDEKSLGRLVKDRCVSLYDFGGFTPSVKHLGLTFYAAGRSLALKEDLAQLSPAQRSRALRNLKEARINLLKMLLASPDNVATLVLLARVDLFPVCHYIECGDPHLVELNIRRAIEHLRLALRYEGSAEITSLLAIASSRFLQFCASHYNAEFSGLYSGNLAVALKLDPCVLDTFFFDTLRERNCFGRQLLLGEVKRQRSLETRHSCDGCSKQIVLHGSSDARFKCLVCADYDLCSRCARRKNKLALHGHPFAELSFAEHLSSSSLSRSGEGRRHACLLLAERVSLASRNLTRLVLADTNVDADELVVLDWSCISILDVQNCRHLVQVPGVVLSSLNVSNCLRLAATAADVLKRNAATLTDIRAKGLVGDWDEAVFVSDPDALPRLQLLDLTRRTFLERMLIHSKSLERLYLTNATHVGGLVVCQSLQVLHAQGSELLTSVLISGVLVEPNLLALSQRIELAEKEEQEQIDLKASGSKLANFLRQHSSSSKLSFNKLPSKDCYLNVHSHALREVRLDNSSVSSVVAESDTLRVLSLFRCPDVSFSLSCPTLTTLYLSQWSASPEMITAAVLALPRSLLNLFFCELGNFDFALHLRSLFDLPALRYLNLYRSGSSSSLLADIASPSLLDLSLEQCPFVQRVRVLDAPLLKRIVLCGAPCLVSCEGARQFFASPSVPGATAAEPRQLWPFPAPVETGQTLYQVPL